MQNMLNTDVATLGKGIVMFICVAVHYGNVDFSHSIRDQSLWQSVTNLPQVWTEETWEILFAVSWITLADSSPPVLTNVSLNSLTVCAEGDCASSCFHFKVNLQHIFFLEKWGRVWVFLLCYLGKIRVLMMCRKLVDISDCRKALVKCLVWVSSFTQVAVRAGTFTTVLEKNQDILC